MVQFPLQSIPENQKDEEWHKQNIISIIQNDDQYGPMVSERMKDIDNYKIFDGILDPKQFTYVTDMYGIAAPARFVNWPMMNSRIELLAGELVSQGLQFTTMVVNRDAIARKNEKKIGIAVETVLRPIRREIEGVLGMKIPDEDLGEEVPKDVEEYSNYKFRDAVEVMIHHGLSHLIEKYKLPHVFKKGFYDLAICNKAFYKVYIKDGDPFVKRVDPRNMIWDKDSDEEFIHESGFAGDRTWYTINEIIDRFKLTKKQVEKLEELGRHEKSYFDNLGLDFEFYRFDDSGSMSICVTEMQWRSIRMMKYKVSPNPYDPDNDFYKMMSDDYEPKKGENIQSFGFTDVRKGVLIGHDLLIDWGRKSNQIRHADNYQKTSLDYYGIIKNNFTGSSLSVVDALKNVQIFRNINFFHIERITAQGGGKAVVYDVSQKPSKIPLEDVFYHAKNSGLVLINSKQEGNKYVGGTQFNQFPQIDFSLSNSLQQLMNLNLMLEETADRMTGISAARAGINKSGDLVGVNERNVMQSTLITAPLYDAHYAVVEQVFNGLANLMPFAWANSGKMVNILGDLGLETTHIDDSIAHDFYGIYVKNNAKEIGDRNMMLGLINNYANSGVVDPIAAIRAVRMTSTTEMENMLVSSLKEVQAKNLDLQEASNAEQKRANDLLERKLKQEMDIAQLNSDTELEVARMTMDGGIAKGESLNYSSERIAGSKNAMKEKELDFQYRMKMFEDNMKKHEQKAKPKPAAKKPQPK